MSAPAPVLARHRAALPRGVAIACPIDVQRASNALMWDSAGRRYIDFAAGIAVLNTGHRHPRVVQAVLAQLECFTHTAYQVVPYEIAVSLAERLNSLVPVKGDIAKTAFFTTGAEAVENAVKIARSFTGRGAVVAFGDAFHGRTMMGLALTGKAEPYKRGFGPFPGDVHRVPFPSQLSGVDTQASLAAIQRLFKTDLDPARTAAIIIEPVQGEGGFHVAPPALLQGLRELCDTHGMLLIADEIQSGFGRTGRMFAMEHSGVRADLVALAKSLAGGLPLSAVTGRADVMDAPAPGGLGGTYAAHPLAVAAAHAVLDVLHDEQLCARSEHLGLFLRQRLESVRETDAGIAEVRGAGSMVACEFMDAQGAPDRARVDRIREMALGRGLILLSCGMHGNALRFLYPLTIEFDHFEEAILILEDCLSATALDGVLGRG
jgi:4-aminobutyrate aminotransferase